MAKVNNPTVKYKGVHLGDFPVDIVNRYLETELEAGKIFLTKAAHRHIAVDHAEDYTICIANLQMAIQNPTYIGQDAKHTNNFIVIKRVPGPDRKNMLVAITMQKNNYGFYTVCSTYLISQEDVDKRRARNTLRQVVP